MQALLGAKAKTRLTAAVHISFLISSKIFAL